MAFASRSRKTLTVETLRIIQDSAFATWSRESSWALFAYLIVHTISMGFLVGTGMLIDARILGVGGRIPLPAAGRLLPIMAIALTVAIPSGLLLLISYPAKHLTNPLFYVKLTLVITALLITLAFRNRIFAPSLPQPPGWAKPVAGLSLLLWMAGLTAGKFLEYTNHVLLVY